MMEAVFKNKYGGGVSQTYRSERGVQRPVTEAVLKEQVELLLNEALHHHSAGKRDTTQSLFITFLHG